MEFFVYIYLDPRKKGEYIFENIVMNHQPFYVGIGKGERHLSHLKENENNTSNKIKFNKIQKIISEGHSPIVVKIFENLERNFVCEIEKRIISRFGKIKDGGILTNITDGGDGGITWNGEHHNKRKGFEEIMGVEKSALLRKKLSDNAKLKIGELNPNFGKGEKIRGENHYNFKCKLTGDVKNKISNSLKKYFSEINIEQRGDLTKKQHVWFSKMSEDEKIEHNQKISNSLKGRIFSEEHKKKLSETHFKYKNKGSDLLKLSEETKKKISDSTKGKKLSQDHIDKLRKGYTYEEWKESIPNFIVEHNIESITDYRNRCRDLDNKMPKSPEGAFKRHDWEGWDNYRNLFK